VEIESGTSIFIRKTTAVWLLQEDEPVSTDRLFRVRHKQPFSSNASTLAVTANMSVCNPAVVTGTTAHTLAFVTGTSVCTPAVVTSTTVCTSAVVTNTSVCTLLL